MKLNCGLTKKTKRRNKFIEKEKRELAYIEALEKEREFLREWHTWYAWRPVKIKDNDCRIFEYIERRYPDAYTKYDNKYGWFIELPCKVEYRSKT